MKGAKEFLKFIFFLVLSFLMASSVRVQEGVKRIRVEKSKLIYKTKYCWRLFTRGKAKADELIDPVELRR